VIPSSAVFDQTFEGRADERTHISQPVAKETQVLYGDETPTETDTGSS